MAPSPPARPPCAKCGYLVEAATGAVNFCPKCGNDLRATPVAEEPATKALLNTVVADRYRLLSLLGEGGMGAVYKAEHIRMGKALALKVLRGAFAREAGAVARFRSEAQIVSRLSHPHTIAVFDFGELPEGDGFYLAMEYVPGRDLAALLRETRTLPESRTVEIGQQILGSLAEAHDAGIVHRDMKPGNVMLMQTRSGEDFVKVLDFGIAKLRDESATTTTSAGAIIGTPSYLSPEQARGELIDARADLYSVGALLFELLAGRPPFHGMSPVAVVSAHLHDAPPALLSLAPGVSEELSAIIHKALEKKADRRWASADEMRSALLQLASPRAAAGPATPRATTVTTGDLKIASRQDFEEFEQEVARLRRSRVSAPLVAFLLLAALGLTLWRWPDVYAFLQARVPAVGRALPAALRPPDLYDGEEHEPNNAPAQANPLPLPPGPDGAQAGGVAVIRGHVGAKVSDTSGDIDVFRVEVPPGVIGRVLTADWSGEQEGEGIRGLDVALTLNRQRGADSERTSAPLVASVDHGGPGQPERLRALVEPGTYFLAVREKHAEATGPVEKPTDWYRLTVRLAPPEPGEEVEPNDAPEDAAARSLRYPEWLAVGVRNPVGEGRGLRGTLSAADADVMAVGRGAPGEAPEVLAVVPDERLAVAVEVWRPDAIDLDPPANADRVRFEQRADGVPGEVLFVSLGGVPAADAPTLVRLKAPRGEGHWVAVGLGAGAASGTGVVALAGELAKAGRSEAALELCAAYVKALPAAAARTEVLLAAGRIAEALAAALPPAELSRLDRASRRLGQPILEAGGGGLRYRATFEALAEGAGPLVEAAGLRVVALGAPCTPAEVAARAEAFLKRWPASALAGDARLWRARGLDGVAAALAAGKGEPAARARAVAAWRLVAEERGPGEAEAKDRLRVLGARGPVPDPLAPLCR